MKKIVLTATAFAALAAPAFAADLPARPVKAPPPMLAPIYDWTGFYIGGNGGWGESRNCWGIVPVAGALIPDGSATAALTIGEIP
jgi:outer membrane immunogenic protein